MLNVISKIIFMSLLLCAVVFAQPDRQSVSVTVYNDNLGVVKEVRSLDIISGLQTIKLTDVPALIDPTSVHIKLNGTVLEQNYQYDLVGLAKILYKYVDSNVQLKNAESGEIVEGKLLSIQDNQIVLQKPDGGLVMLPNITDYRITVASLPDGLITRPTLVWLVQALQAGKQDVELTYQTGGMGWHAEYVTVLNDNDTELDLNAWVSISNNSGATFSDASLKLVAGDINRAQDRFYDADLKVQFAPNVAEMEPMFQEQSFFEYHIYDLQRKTTLAQQETKQISLFEAAKIPAVKRYVFNSIAYSGTNENLKPDVIIEFENKTENKLGVPMPKGKVRVYKSDGKSVEFIGEDWIDHTPAKEKIKLTIGQAFDIRITDAVTDARKIAEKVNEQTYSVTIKNRKTEDVTVEVNRNLGWNWEVLNSSLPFEKIDAQNIRFKVPVSKDSEVILTFKVRYVN